MRPVRAGRAGPGGQSRSREGPDGGWGGGPMNICPGLGLTPGRPRRGGRWRGGLWRNGRLFGTGRDWVDAELRAVAGGYVQVAGSWPAACAGVDVWRTIRRCCSEQGQVQVRDLGEGFGTDGFNRRAFPIVAGGGRRLVESGGSYVSQGVLCGKRCGLRGGAGRSGVAAF